MHTPSHRDIHDTDILAAEADVATTQAEIDAMAPTPDTQNEPSPQTPATALLATDAIICKETPEGLLISIPSSKKPHMVNDAYTRGQEYLREVKAMAAAINGNPTALQHPSPNSPLPPNPTGPSNSLVRGAG